VFYLLPPSPGVSLPGRYYREFSITTRFRCSRHSVVPLQSVVGLQCPTSAALLAPDSHIRRSGRDLTIPCEQEQPNNTQERDAGEEMEVALALFASFLMSAERVQQIVRWEMAVLRESPWYQAIVQEGVQEGLFEAVLHLVQTRFDLSSSAVEGLATQLQGAREAEVLRQLLVDAANAESIDEFRVSLEMAATITTPVPSVSV